MRFKKRNEKSQIINIKKYLTSVFVSFKLSLKIANKLENKSLNKRRLSYNKIILKNCIPQNILKKTQPA